MNNEGHKRAIDVTTQVALNDSLRLCDRLCSTYTELAIIKTHLIDGSYDSHLHTVTNTGNALLQELGCYLPPVVDGVGCESLITEYIVRVDASMETLSETIKNALKTMIEAFKEWFLDYWDNNRRYRIQLRQILAEMRVDINKFGSREEFDKLEINCYHYDAWSTMIDACKNMNDILTTLPESDIKNWYNKNLEKLNNCMQSFGISIKDMHIIKGDPKYDRTFRRMDTARWQYGKLQSYVNRAIDTLGDEIDMRKDLDRVNKAYNKACSANDEDGDKTRRELMFAINLIKTNKINVDFVTRSLIMICATAKRVAAQKHTTAK